MTAPALSTQAMRDEYAAARCNTGQFATFAIHGWPTRLYCERHCAVAFEALSDVFARHDYRFRESAGGTYNCRQIAGSSSYSLHSYGLALDINPSVNGPQGTGNTDMSRAMIDDVLALSAGGRQVFQWGGDWSPASRDPMHFQIGVTKAELAAGIIDPNGKDDDVLTDDDKQWLAATIRDEVAATARQVWTFDLHDDVTGDDVNAAQLLRWARRQVFEQPARVWELYLDNPVAGDGRKTRAKTMLAAIRQLVDDQGADQSQ